MQDIFKGLSGLIKNKKTQNDQKIVHRDPAPILSPDSLLSTEKRQQALADTRGLLSLPDEDYEKIFLSVAKNFAEFVQNLPETERSYYANIGGMLDHALERASLSLFLCRTYLLPEDATLASVSEKEILWIYAVYTAALFYDIGKIPMKHIVTLTDEVGVTLKSWLPYEGPMTREHASHYAYSFSEEHHDHMRWLITPLLASQILPREGFLWLTSDPDVFHSWIGLLSGDDQRQVGSLLTVIPLADAQLLESYFTDRKVFRHNLSPQTIALLSKFQKERKVLLQRQKELRDKLLAEQAEKSKDSQDKKSSDKNLDHNHDHEPDKDKKINKQSMFGTPTSPHQEKETKPAISHDAKDLTQRFMQWMLKNLDTLNKNQKDPLILNFLNEKNQSLIIDVKALQQFIAENKIAQLTTADLQKLIVQTEIARPVTYESTQIIQAQQSGRIPALEVSNAYLLFPGGTPPSLATLVGNPVQPQQQQINDNSLKHMPKEQLQEKMQANQEAKKDHSIIPRLIR